MHAASLPSEKIGEEHSQAAAVSEAKSQAAPEADQHCLPTWRAPGDQIPRALDATAKGEERRAAAFSEEQRHFQAPRLDLLKAERVPPPRHGCPPAWGVSVSDLSLLRAVSRLAAALRPLLARAPEPKPAAKGIFKVPPSKSAEEMGGAPRDPPKRTAAAQCSALQLVLKGFDSFKECLCA